MGVLPFLSCVAGCLWSLPGKGRGGCWWMAVGVVSARGLLPWIGWSLTPTAARAICSLLFPSLLSRASERRLPLLSSPTALPPLPAHARAARLDAGQTTIRRVVDVGHPGRVLARLPLPFLCGHQEGAVGGAGVKERVQGRGGEGARDGQVERLGARCRRQGRGLVST